ncbi:MAG: hypothetical protein EBV93_05245 [Actinobacteria bacterium]|nr:hypothetical protein [Actinomycetota bacterium]
MRVTRFWTGCSWRKSRRANISYPLLIPKECNEERQICGPAAYGSRDSWARHRKQPVRPGISRLQVLTFFLVAGLELKYELTVGVLSKPSTALVPILAGVGGVILPALIYTAFNWGTEYMVGWPIPTATDIAFALGILAIFGRGMPKSARVFLLALAIFDDLVAILIIAIFYTEGVKIEWLLAAAVVLGGHSLAERFNKLPINYVRVLTFILVWYAVYQSGVHATIAGVALGLIIPAKKTHSLVGKIQPWTVVFSPLRWKPRRWMILFLFLKGFVQSTKNITM